MRVYEAIVKGLEGVGVEVASGGAGENAASLMLALKHAKKIRPIMTRHEQAAWLLLAVENDIPVIEAKITRWAVPHYSPSPDGVIAGIIETIENRFLDD